jgi:hypothetical protein
MKQIVYAIGLLFLLNACTKNKESALLNKSVLSFTMDARDYSFDHVTLANQYQSCGVQQIEIQAMNAADEFFVINITGDSDSIKPGIFIMDQIPTNSVIGSCTFWYQGLGKNHTPQNFTITVLSYKDNMLKATFTGDRITNGKISDLVVNSKRPYWKV